MGGHNIYIPRLFKLTTYGFVYNWWAAIGDTNGDGVSDKELTSNDDWILAEWSDWHNLADVVEPGWWGLNDIGARLKTVGFEFWLDSGNPDDYGKNTVGFSGRGAGERASSSGVYIGGKSRLSLWRPETYSSTEAFNINIYYDDNRVSIPGSATTGSYFSKNNGGSIRIVRRNSPLADGASGTYQGNNGKIYPTICIGNDEWLQVNLEETEWRDGETIPQVGWDAAGNTEWVNATSAAMAIP